ncbi:hypothetical protein BDV93DRAFT_437216 [Ceratobasidium sp. AG-I]|nr:hypothetical protein BDV93DRAFT_437216 [Ceratobasidium sp. AG-I]
MPGTSLPTGPESAPKIPSPLRSDTRESGESRRSKSKNTETNGEPTAAPAAVVKANTGDESEDDSDLDDFAFDHPNTYKDAPWIWIPEDELGISKALLKELHDARVEASDTGAKVDKKGVVEVSRNPPEEAWDGGLDI